MYNILLTLIIRIDENNLDGQIFEPRSIYIFPDRLPFKVLEVKCNPTNKKLGLILKLNLKEETV